MSDQVSIYTKKNADQEERSTTENTSASGARSREEERVRGKVLEALLYLLSHPLSLLCFLQSVTFQTLYIALSQEQSLLFP